MASAARREHHADPVGGSVTMAEHAHARLLATVGPRATSAFYAVTMAATHDERGVLVTTTSARALAYLLGVDKDTAAADLQALIRRGHLRRLAQSRSGGRFAAARYVVRPPEGVVVSPRRPVEPARPFPAQPDTTPTRPRAAAPTQPETAKPPRRARRPGSGATAQLGLFTPTTTDERSTR